MKTISLVSAQLTWNQMMKNQSNQRCVRSIYIYMSTCRCTLIYVHVLRRYVHTALIMCIQSGSMRISLYSYQKWIDWNKIQTCLSLLYFRRWFCIFKVDSHVSVCNDNIMLLSAHVCIKNALEISLNVLKMGSVFTKVSLHSVP